MRVHDYHLREYTVHDLGARIVMVLSWDYPGDPRPLSTIEFVGVICYRFTGTGGAIITAIRELNSSEVARDERDFIVSVARSDGLRYWNGTFAPFLQELEVNKVRAFRIE